MREGYPMARPKTPATKQAPKSGTQIALRVDDELLAMIDREAEQLQAARPGLIVTRAEVVRDLLYRALKGKGSR